MEQLPVPSERECALLGLTLGAELHAGHQSRVFRSTLNGAPVVTKLSDSRLVDDWFSRRVEVVASLAEVNPSVVGPVPIGSDLITPLGSWLAVAYPFVAGAAPDLDRRSDVRRLASSLAALHSSLHRLGVVDLPVVAGLRGRGAAAASVGFTTPQLLHGDYSDANVLFGSGGPRIIDFDECGHGPVEFEIGNSLYMVLFGAWMTGDMPRYERFRTWFVDGYRSVSGHAVDDVVLDVAIGLRVDALRGWIDDPERAPIGIRTATSEWHDTLRMFVESRAPG